MFETRLSTTHGNQELVIGAEGFCLLGFSVDGVKILRSPVENGGKENALDSSAFLCGGPGHGRLVRRRGEPPMIPLGDGEFHFDPKLFPGSADFQSWGSATALHGAIAHSDATDLCAAEGGSRQYRLIRARDGFSPTSYQVESKVRLLEAAGFQHEVTLTNNGPLEAPGSLCFHPGFLRDPFATGEAPIIEANKQPIGRWWKDAESSQLFVADNPSEDIGLDFQAGFELTDGLDDAFAVEPGTSLSLVYPKAGKRLVFEPALGGGADKILCYVLCSPPGSDFVFIEPALDCPNSANVHAQGVSPDITGFRTLRPGEKRILRYTLRILEE